MKDNQTDEISLKLTSFVHDLFLNEESSAWLENLSSQSHDRWYSLIVELDRACCPIEKIKEFKEGIYSKFVYRCIPSPGFKTSGEMMILFNISGWVWHSLIFYTPNTVQS